MSAWIMASAKALSSSTSVRSARCRNASDRGTPSWISWSIRANSDESTPGTFRTTCAMAALSERPASTLIVNRSSDPPRPGDDRNEHARPEVLLELLFSQVDPGRGLAARRDLRLQEPDGAM